MTWTGANAAFDPLLLSFDQTHISRTVSCSLSYRHSCSFTLKHLSWTNTGRLLLWSSHRKQTCIKVLHSYAGARGTSTNHMAAFLYVVVLCVFIIDWVVLVISGCRNVHWQLHKRINLCGWVCYHENQGEDFWFQSTNKYQWMTTVLKL